MDGCCSLDIDRVIYSYYCPNYQLNHDHSNSTNLIINHITVLVKALYLTQQPNPLNNHPLFIIHMRKTLILLHTCIKNKAI